MSSGNRRRSDGQALRSRAWFDDNPDNLDMTALYLERYLNFGLQPRGAAVGQADHRHRPDRVRPVALQPPPSRAGAARARGHPRGGRHRHRISGPPDPGNRQAPHAPGSTATSPISASVEVLYGYPLDGVVLTIGCDKTTPAMLMGAATVNIPAIASRSARCSTAGTRASAPARARSCGRRARCLRPARSTTPQFIDLVASFRALDGLLQHHGHGHDDELAGRGARHVAAGFGAAIPAPYRDRAEMAYRTGKRIVEMVRRI